MKITVNGFILTVKVHNPSVEVTIVFNNEEGLLKKLEKMIKKSPRLMTISA